MMLMRTKPWRQWRWLPRDNVNNADWKKPSAEYQILHDLSIKKSQNWQRPKVDLCLFRTVDGWWQGGAGEGQRQAKGAVFLGQWMKCPNNGCDDIHVSMDIQKIFNYIFHMDKLFSMCDLSTWVDSGSPWKHTCGVSMTLFPERFN